MSTSRSASGPEGRALEQTVPLKDVCSPNSCSISEVYRSHRFGFLAYADARKAIHDLHLSLLKSEQTLLSNCSLWPTTTGRTMTLHCVGYSLCRLHPRRRDVRCSPHTALLLHPEFWTMDSHGITNTHLHRFPSASFVINNSYCPSQGCKYTGWDSRNRPCLAYPSLPETVSRDPSRPSV